MEMMRLFVFVIFNIFNLLIRENTGSVVNDDGISSNSEHLVIRLPELGQLKGSTIQTARTNETIFQFLDVKYGESPSGERRFKAPVAIKKWNGIKNADKYGQRCPQLGDLAQMTEAQRKGLDVEDCLSLCVYSKKLEESANYPVIVYIHGGGFTEGGSDLFSPVYYLERDIVFVVPQFRLDSIGFLSTQSDEIPGNAGLLDVILALEWIQKNIKHFGGDRQRVTLVGQSAGGAMVSALGISPNVPSHLFQRIITQSSSSFSSWCYDRNPIRAARNIAQTLGLPKNVTLNELNRALLEADVLELLQATQESSLKQYSDTPSSGRVLTIGGPTNLLPQTPYEIARTGQYRKDLDVLAGATKHDASFITAELYDLLESKGLTNNTEYIKRDFIPSIARKFGFDDDAGGTVGMALNIYWTPEQMESGSFKEIANGLTDFLGTITIKGSSLRLAQVNSRFNPNNTFLYTYDYRGQFTRFGYGKDTSKYPFSGGVHHSNDNLNFFPYPDYAAHLNAADTEMSRKMVNLWTSFATTGRPKATFDGEDDVEWLPFTDVNGPYLHIDKEFSMGNRYRDEFTAAIREANNDRV